MNDCSFPTTTSISSSWHVNPVNPWPEWPQEGWRSYQPLVQWNETISPEVLLDVSLSQFWGSTACKQLGKWSCFLHLHKIYLLVNATSGTCFEWYQVAFPFLTSICSLVLPLDRRFNQQLHWRRETLIDIDDWSLRNIKQYERLYK